MFLLALIACRPTPEPLGDDTAPPDVVDGVLDAATMDRVAITGPGWGQDHATDAATVTVTGVASGPVTWETSSASGDATGTDTWSAQVPLEPGDNRVIVRSGDAGDAIVLTYTPGVSWRTGLRADHRHVRVGVPTTVTVRVDVDADSVRLDHGDVALTQDRPGSWTGQLEWTPTQDERLEFRAVAQVGDAQGQTPPWTLVAVETPDMDAALALADQAQSAAEGLEPGDAANAIAKLEGVQGVLIGANSVSWVQESGLTFVLPTGAPGTKGTVESADGAAMAPWYQDWPGTGDVVWYDYSESFGAKLAGQTCPQPDSLIQEYDLDADVSAFERSLGAGLVHFSTHGVESYMYLRDYYQDGTAESWVIVGAGETALMTGEELVAGDNDQYLDDLVDGDIVLVRSKGRNYLGLRAGWFRDALTVNPMPNSVVALDACLSAAKGHSLPNALLEGDAGFVWGFDEVVWSDESYEAAESFWTSLVDGRMTAGQAAQDAKDQVTFTKVTDRPRAPEMVWDGDPDLVQGFPWVNGSFEQGYEDWGSTRDYGNGDVRTFDWYVASDVRGVSAQDGTYFAGMELHADAQTYAEIHQYTCPSPGTQVWIDFQWQVLTEEAPSCSSAAPNWMNLRLDDDAGAEVLWQIGWSDVCGQLGAQGGLYATGWQHEIVVVDVPEGFDPDSSRVVFATGGYNDNTWVGMVDAVTLEVVE
jgi:hypothetical protein